MDLLHKPTSKTELEKWKRHLFMVGGFISLALGLIGLFLPIMPTAPFVILAAICFSRGSKRWHQWLLNHPKLGPPLRDWEEHGVVRLRAKIAATVLTSISVISTSVFVPIAPIWKILVATTIFSVMTYVWTRPSEPPRS